MGLLTFMSFAVPTVPERFNNWLDKSFDFHIVILELLLSELFLKYFSPTWKTNEFCDPSFPSN